MFKKTRLLAFLMVFVMVISTMAYAAPGGNSNVAFDRKVLARIDSEKVLEHIRYLSEEVGPRVAASAEEKAAADYIMDVFEKWGYEPELQPFEYFDSEAALTADGTDFAANAPSGAGYFGFTDAAGISGVLVPCGLGYPEEIPASVAGKIALIKRGELMFSEKAANAEAKGAIGVILYNNRPGTLSPSITSPEVHIPVVMITQADGEALLNTITGGKEVLVNKLSVMEIPRYSQNVIAVRKPKGNKANNGIIYVTAHYDSVPGAPGANDNASGTAMMLEFAKILKAYPIDKEVRFIACGAEEVGLLGSYYYADQLTEEELDRSVANFNMDMIGTSYEACDILYADTVDGESNLVVEAAEASGARLGNNIIEVGMGSSSDHAPFGELGIPAACFIYGDEDGNLEPYYHQPEDTIEINISADRLEKAGQIIGSALYDVLRVKTPNLEKSALKNTYKGIKTYSEAE